MSRGSRAQGRLDELRRTIFYWTSGKSNGEISCLDAAHATRACVFSKSIRLSSSPISRLVWRSDNPTAEATPAVEPRRTSERIINRSRSSTRPLCLGNIKLSSTFRSPTVAPRLCPAISNLSRRMADSGHKGLIAITHKEGA